jgi:molecular chaperone GrpE
MAEQSRRSKPTEAPDVDRMDDEGATESVVDPAPALADEIVELRKERDALHDRLLRQAAEFDNFRKRVERDRKDLVQSASLDFVQELLPVIDDFERALQIDAPGADSYRQGIEIIHRALMEMLRKRGVTPVDAVGMPFDPQVHQAVAYEEAPDRRDGEVMEQFTRGYRLGDKLVRPAMVKVAKA